MKPNKFSSILRPALTASAMVITMTMAHAGTPAATAPAEPAPLANWINFTIGGAFVSGDEASFNQRTQSSDFYGGIEDMMFTHEINDSTTLTIDGHAIPGNEDYEFNMNITKADLGYFKAGFKQFRTWYDASGGYLKGANMDASEVDNQFNDEQSIDRGEIYVETGLRMEKMPEITFSYRHLYRDGQKNSTCWGDSRANTSWGGVTDSNPAFKFMPALWDIDETTDIFELDVEHTIGNTDLGMGLVYESYSIDNTRTTPRWGSRTNPKPQPTTYGINNIKINEETDADMFAGHISSVTRFNDKAWLSFAASYSNMNNDTDGGSRSYIYSPLTLPSTTPQGDYSYDQMSGGSNVNVFVTNLNFMWVPITDLTITPSLRYENEQMDTISKFRAFNATRVSSGHSWRGDQSLSANTDMNSMTEALEIRYTGLDNIVLYAKGEWGQESEDIKRQDEYLPGEFLSTKNDIDEQEYTIGANWYVLSNLSFSIQGLYAQREQELDHNEGSQPDGTDADGGANNFRPIMTEHDSQIYDFNARMTWRPMSNLSLVTRYDYCHTQYDNRGITWSLPDDAIDYPSIQSGSVLSNIVSQSVTWSPMAALYIQGSVSWISSETDTPEQITGDADNDYFFGSLTAGYAIDDKTEITASYTYYQTDNYVNSQELSGINTMGYGTNTEEQMIALTLTRVINPNIVWNLRYAFITSNTEGDDQTGGYDDFNANMVSTGLQIRF